MPAGSKARRKPRSNLLTHLALVFPCLLVYEGGVLLLGLSERNGVDLLTDEIGSRVGYGTFGILLIAVFGALLLYLRRTQKFEWNALLPILLESGIYALSMGTLILFVMVDVLGVSPTLEATLPEVPMAVRSHGPIAKVVLSFGAGIHEELFFRLLLFGGILAAGEQLGVGRLKTLVVAYVVSSVLFSLAHHVGPFGDPLKLSIFLYRFLAGLFFAALYHLRGFAVAVYTHALYDVYVMLLR
jgi:membrane protease YdiL (CAAX protease family)